MPSQWKPEQAVNGIDWQAVCTACVHGLFWLGWMALLPIEQLRCAGCLVCVTQLSSAARALRWW
jgi:hypothetical protein